VAGDAQLIGIFAGAGTGGQKGVEVFGQRQGSRFPDGFDREQAQSRK